MAATLANGAQTHWIDGLPVSILRKSTTTSRAVGAWLDGLPVTAYDQTGAGGGGGFQSAWAAHVNSVVGAGVLG